MDIKNIIPNHPGSSLSKEMKSRGLNQQDLASILGIASSQMSEITNGKRNITAAFAVKLEGVFGIEAEYWNDMQSSYNLALAREVAESESSTPNQFSVRESSILSNYIPVKFFKEQGLLVNKPKKDRKTICDIFGVKNFMDIPDQFQAFERKYRHFRVSEKLQKDKINEFGWDRLVRIRAKRESVGKFNFAAKDEIISDLKLLFWKHYRDSATDVVSSSRKILSAFGIKYITQSKPAKFPVCGYAFREKNTPVVAMTLRYKRLDNFAFTLLHELGHVFLHYDDLDNNLHFDDLGNGNKKGFEKGSEMEKIEAQADDFAQDNLIPKNLWNDFRYRKKTDNSILAFANQYKIHPGIIRGRLCRIMPSLYKRRTTINAMNKLHFPN